MLQLEYGSNRINQFKLKLQIAFLLWGTGTFKLQIQNYFKRFMVSNGVKVTKK